MTIPIEPFKITWGEPCEGLLPAGTKVRRDTGLVAELLEDARAEWTRNGWKLLPKFGRECHGFWVDVGGKREVHLFWTIDGVGMRDDGLAWLLPQSNQTIALPDGTPVRSEISGDRLLKEDATVNELGELVTARTVGARVATRDGSLHGCQFRVIAVGLPRPQPHDVFRNRASCEVCGEDLTPLNGCLRRVAVLAYNVCGEHDLSEAEFLAAVMKRREQERLEDQARALDALNPMSEEQKRARARALGLYDDVLAEANREISKAIRGQSVVSEPPKVSPGEQLRAARVAKLGELLRQPMAPRFAEEQPLRGRFR